MKYVILILIGLFCSTDGLCQNIISNASGFQEHEGIYSEWILTNFAITNTNKNGFIISYFKDNGRDILGSNKDNKISIFPNPFSEALIIKSRNELVNLNLNLLSAQGVLVFKDANVYLNTENNYSLNQQITGLSPGIYYLTIMNSEINEVFKIIKH